MKYVVKIVDEFLLEDIERDIDVEIFENEDNAKSFMNETFQNKIQEILKKEKCSDLFELESNMTQYDYDDEESKKHLFYMDDWNYGRDITITLVEKEIR